VGVDVGKDTYQDLEQLAAAAMARDKRRGAAVARD